MVINIVGYGVVGKSMHKLFPQAEINMHKADVSFICVPTAMLPDGSCDTSIVEDVISKLDSDLIIIRSTVSVGTTDRLKKKYKKNIVFQPEYIGETVAHPYDEKQIPFIILGGDLEDCKKAVRLYQTVYNANIRIHFVTCKEAEIIKYMENSAIGTKVTFCNEFYNICKAFGADYHMVREGFLMDNRMARDFTFVYPDNQGFDGKCLPKDLNAIVKASEGAGYTPLFIKDVLKNNDRIRTEAQC